MSIPTSSVTAIVTVRAQGHEREQRQHEGQIHHMDLAHRNPPFSESVVYGSKPSR